MQTQLEEPIIVHQAFNKISEGAPNLREFSFPQSWREYQDDRYGESERIERERQMSLALEKSGVTKVAHVLGNDGETCITTAFLLDVKESEKHIAQTAYIIDRLGTPGDGRTPSAHELEKVLPELAKQGYAQVYCIPSKAQFHELIADLQVAKESLSLSADTGIIFSWSGQTLFARADESTQSIYNKILAI